MKTPQPIKMEMDLDNEQTHLSDNTTTGSGPLNTNNTIVPCGADKPAQSLMEPLSLQTDRSKNWATELTFDINSVCVVSCEEFPPQYLSPQRMMSISGSGSKTHLIVPKIHNIVATAILGCELDLKKIVQCARNVEYNPRRFNAVIMRIRNPRTTALIFSSGNIVVTGAKKESDARKAAQKFTRIIQKVGFPARLAEYQIRNMVGSCDVTFRIRLECLKIMHPESCCYEPELFPGLIYRMKQPRVAVLIFVSGKVVLLGANGRQNINRAFHKILPILKKYRYK